MVTFLLILGGLILFNFILLKFSIQSVDKGKNKIRSSKLVENEIVKPADSKEIAKAA